MKKITIQMINIYKITNIDFMGYKLMEKDTYDFHHIHKKEHGGKYSLDNGAVLCHSSSHRYLHTIEHKDLDMYVYINKILKDINNQGYLPTKEQLLLIFDCLDRFEKEYSGAVNSKGKPLIKEEYTKRKIIY